MMTRVSLVLACLLFLLSPVAAEEPLRALPDAASPAQGSPGAAAAGLAPRLIRYTGNLKAPDGQVLTGVCGVTFALYKEREGGAPLWIETQNVEPDEQGNYVALLGANSIHGLDPDLFASGEPRWLGAQLQLPGRAEEPRALLVSVPYALKAADAETLGGLPLSAFVLRDPQGPLLARTAPRVSDGPGYRMLATGGPPRAESQTQN